MPQLHVENVTLTFGGLNALTDVSLTIPAGEIVSIIGPNGAGKTSLLNCISGFYHPTRGRITYGEHDLSRAAPNVVTGYGIARAFQNLELFRGLSVVENLLLARHTHLRYSLLDSLLFHGRASRQEAENRAYVERVIDFMELEQHRTHPVGTLAYGIQKRVEVARALTLAPSLLLLDEPMAGMNVEEKEDMVRFILDIRREQGITVVLIEHDLGVVMDISDHVHVLDFGQKIAGGRPEEVSADPRVIEAYTGVSAPVAVGA
ncbi:MULTISPECIES: ABC transporter ATP-binding protein [Deinococcus]|uniref:ABC transporter ATP-binding protein n=1 Tax=Deinococcus rufus TaxID=2136097 RepID=A0ABV7ZDI2_9DEIO|nr:ABC transporter ATP-binding protein [Deinococcus sp. AB2017081]WQE96899.1 ABC transporter ATP-binding protein [Deinococcus sp. AB2017081]